MGGPARPADCAAPRPRRGLARLGPPGRRPGRRHDRRQPGDAAGARRARRPVRRAADADPETLLHLDGRDEGRERAWPRQDRGRGARGRRRIRGGPAQDRRRARQPRRDDREAARDRTPPRARRDRLRLVAVGARAGHELRPRVRAGAADRDTAGARAGPARAGRRARFARVHGDTLRPDPAWPLPRRAGDDRAEDLGRPEDAGDLGPRALPRRRRGSGRGVRGARRAGGRLDPRRRPRAALALPRPDRGRPDGELRALHLVQVGRGQRGEEPPLVPERRPRGAARRRGRARRGRRDHAAARDRVLQLGRPDLEERRRDRARRLWARRRGRPRRLRLQPPALAAALTRGPGRGRALGGVPPLPDRLSAPRHRAGGVARALGALPRLRDRVRDRRARAPGGAAAHAGGARHRRARSTGSGRTATSPRARRR